MFKSGQTIGQALGDRRANAAIIFGLAALPTFALLGFAIDYGISLSNKAKLDAAADAAAMTAITTAKNVIQNSPSGGASATQAAITQAQAAAVAAFKANAGRLPYAADPVLTVNQTTRAGQTVTATVTYSTSVATTFSRILNIASMPVSNTSVASLALPTYINYYILVDTSQSMGIGATATDMQNLYNRVVSAGNYDTLTNSLTKVGCVFGCHVATGLQFTSNENLAHNTAYGTPITLRIDSAKSAIQTILTDAQNANTSAGLNLIQVGVYSMQQNPQSPGSYLQAVSSPPSADFTTVGTKVSSMTLGNNNAGGTGDTGFQNSITYFVNNILPAQQGDGSSAASPLSYVFIITDGLSDLPGACASGHCTGSFVDTTCAPIKAQATVGVIYTTYLPIYTKNNAALGYDPNFVSLWYPYVGNIPPNLTSCASRSNLYFEASDGPSITSGLQKLFASTASQARLTQ